MTEKQIDIAIFVTVITIVGVGIFCFGYTLTHIVGLWG
jgi:hypothetical protein